MRNAKETVLPCNEYIAPQGLWLTVRGASIKISPEDDGIVVDIYPLGREDEEAIAGTWVTYNELSSEENDNEA